jgi:hypothetical protein
VTRLKKFVYSELMPPDNGFFSCSLSHCLSLANATRSSVIPKRQSAIPPASVAAAAAAVSRSADARLAPDYCGENRHHRSMPIVELLRL